MAVDEPGEDGEAQRRDEPEVECSMCHQRVGLSQSASMSGRVLCFGCAAAWFDEDEHESDE